MLVKSAQSDQFRAKFVHKIPTKSAIFYWLVSGEVSPENFHKSVSENSAKFDFHDLSQAR